MEAQRKNDNIPRNLKTKISSRNITKRSYRAKQEIKREPTERRRKTWKKYRQSLNTEKSTSER